MIYLVFVLLLSYDLSLARVRYGGGGDWYNDPCILPNLAKVISERTPIDVAPEEVVVSLLDPSLFKYPFLFMTGHGKVVFSKEEARSLRRYLEQGGFLYVDDDYGLDRWFRREIKKVFPERKLVEIPWEHPIYHCFYDFPDGLPKIHRHDGKPPQGFGIFLGRRLVVFYTYETNISDGWADPEVHNDPPRKREEAFRMGINIVMYALTH